MFTFSIIPEILSDHLAPSIFMESPISKLLLLIFMISVLSYKIGFFLAIEKNLGGTKIVKGLKYGLSFARLIFWFLWRL